jgi:hypothetical protein
MHFWTFLFRFFPTKTIFFVYKSFKRHRERHSMWLRKFTWSGYVLYICRVSGSVLLLIERYRIRVHVFVLKRQLHESCDLCFVVNQLPLELNSVSNLPRYSRSVYLANYSIVYSTDKNCLRNIVNIRLQAKSKIWVYIKVQIISKLWNRYFVPDLTISYFYDDFG